MGLRQMSNQSLSNVCAVIQSLLACIVFGAVNLSASVIVPGAHVPTLTRSLVGPDDLRSLRLSMDLNADQLQSAHALLTQHQEQMRRLQSALQEAIRKAAPDGAMAAQARQEAFQAQAEQIREEIERRRQSGEFQGRPEAIKEAFEEAMMEAQREIDAGSAQMAQLDGWADAFQQQVHALQDLQAQVEELELQTQAALIPLVEESQLEALHAWWVDRELTRDLRQGRLSGEMVDVLRLWEKRGVVRTLEIEEKINSWRVSHLDFIRKRRQALWEVPQAAVRSIRHDRIGTMQAATDSIMQARADVRDSHLALAESLGQILSDQEQADWMGTVRRRMYPAVWRQDRAMRAMAAALQRSDLEPAQKVAIEQLVAEHQEWCDSLRVEHVHAINEDEPKQLGYLDVMQVQQYLSGPAPKPPSRTKIQRLQQAQDRAELDIMRSLMELLTEAQWAEIPGTATDYVRD